MVIFHSYVSLPEGTNGKMLLLQPTGSMPPTWSLFLPSPRSLGDPNFDSGRPKMLKATEAARLHGNSWHLWLNHGRMAHGHDSFLCPMVMLHIDGPEKSM
jgi:hypothetical protein